MRKIYLTMILIIFCMIPLGGCQILEIRPSTEEEVEEAKEEGLISEEATTDDTVTIISEVTDKEVTEIPITEEYFPDEVFRQYIKDKIDQDDDEILSEKEINETIQIIIGDSTAYIEINYPGLYDLSGIEYFPNLGSLHVFNSPIEEIDVSNNTNLCVLSIEGCNIKTIDISNNKALIDAANCCHYAAIYEASDRIEKPYYYTIVSYNTFAPDDEENAVVFKYDYGTEIITGDYTLDVPLEDNRTREDCCFY